MQPLRQEAVGVGFLAAVEGDAVGLEQLLQAPFVKGIEGFGAAADVFAADEDLRDGRKPDPLAQSHADVAAAVVLLVGEFLGDRPLSGVASRPADAA